MPGYIGNDPAGSATKIARQTYTTSGAATTDFTFTSGYDVGYLDLYIDGVRQTKGTNFTASDGSTFRVLNGGVGTGSTVEAIAYKTFNLATVDFDDLGNTGNLTLSGDISAVDATFSGDVSIGGTLTYEDVTSIDSVGIVTARSGVEIGTPGIAATLTAAGGAVFTGVVTATSFVGDGSGLTGVASTDNINTSTLAQFTGGVGIADSIFHIGDDNTAIRFPAADTFTVETGGSERLRVESGGNIGIGTDNPSGILHVQASDSTTYDASGTGAGQQFGGATLSLQNTDTTADNYCSINFLTKQTATGGSRIVSLNSGNNESTLTFITESSGTPGERLRITSAGDVGIGTASPTSFGPTLQVAGTDPALLLQDTATAVDYFGMNIASGAVNTWFDDASAFVIHTATGLAGSGLVERLRVSSDGNLRTSSSGGETIYEMQRTDSNTTGAVGTINFLASDDHSVASMSAMGDGDNEGAHIVFRTTSAAANESPFNAATAERLRITSDGDLLLGTTSNGGGNRLYVVDNFTDSFVNPTDSILRVENANDSGTTTQASITLTSQTSGSNADSAIVSQAEDGSGNSQLQFWTDTSNGMSEKMRITSDCEVQIFGGEGISAALHLIADQGDDNGDGWRIVSNQDANDLTIANDDSGSFSDLFTFTKAGMLGVGHGTPQFGITLSQTNERVSKIGWEDAGNQVRASIACSSSTDALMFFTGTGDIERMRIASNGEQQHFGTSATNLNIANSASAGNSHEFLFCQHSSTGLANGTNSFRVATDGDVFNTNGTYGSISDQNLKENIVDATSQWDDIKALQVRKYNFREDTGHETHTQLGLIAQEVESVSPGLVETTPVKEGQTVLDADGNQLESIKSISYSVLYMKAVKALQEAQTRIETLETQLTDALARITALEG